MQLWKQHTTCWEVCLPCVCSMARVHPGHTRALCPPQNFWGAVAAHLDEGEGSPGEEGLILMVQLVFHIGLHALLRVDLLLLLHAEQRPRGHGDGDGVLRFGLWAQGQGREGQIREAAPKWIPQHERP